MKKFVLTALCALVSVSAFAQGTIQLSNIGKGIVSYADGGEAAGPEAMVAFATADGTQIGDFSNVLGAGFFSDGSKTLAGLEGEQTLTVIGQVLSGENVTHTGISAPFTVTLGGAGTPPSPAAALPADFSGVSLVAVPEPSTIALAILGGAALFFRRRK